MSAAEEFVVPESMNSFVKDLAADMHNMLVNIKDFDVVIATGEQPNTRSFEAHSHILRTRSPYFDRTLSAMRAKKDSDTYVFKKPNVESKVFDLILKFIYTGVIDFDKENGKTVLNVLVLADELELVKLVDHAQDFLISHKSIWLHRNLVEALHTAEKHDRFIKLKNYCSDTVANQPHLLIEAADFPALEESILVPLLKRDDLKIDEIEIWNNLIRWGVARTPVLKQKQLNEYTKGDFAELKKSLLKCIEHVRFFQISSEDYCDKIKPYKRILPNEINNQLLQYHLKPNAIPPPGALPSRLLIDSVIITSAHAVLIGCWITGKNDTVITDMRPQYEFKLLFRASRDGYAADTFHQKCDSVNGTVVIVRVSQTGCIFGGYNSDCWHQPNAYANDYGYDRAYDYDYQDEYGYVDEYDYRNRNHDYNYNACVPDAFIFGFRNGKDVQHALLARNSGSGQIFRNSTHGPYFYNDLFIADNCNTQQCWYEPCNFSGKVLDDLNQSRYNFQVNDYEVFQVIKSSEKP